MPAGFGGRPRTSFAYCPGCQEMRAGAEWLVAASHRVLEAVANGGKAFDLGVNLAGAVGQQAAQRGVGRPLGEDLGDLAKAEPGGAGGADAGQPGQHLRPVRPTQPDAGDGLDQALALIEAQRRGGEPAVAGDLSDVEQLAHAAPVDLNLGSSASLAAVTDALLVVRDGGGTAPVEIRVARRLAEHGHRVRVAGPRTIAHLASELDFHPIENTEPGPLAVHLMDHLEGADIVVADCMLYGALIAATVGGVPSAALMPTVYLADQLVGSAVAAQPRWARIRAAINDARGSLGLPPVDSVTDQILAANRVLVLTSRAFELPDVRPPTNVVYVGPSSTTQLHTPGIHRRRTSRG